MKLHISELLYLQNDTFLSIYIQFTWLFDCCKNRTVTGFVRILLSVRLASDQTKSKKRHKNRVGQRTHGRTEL